MIKYIHWHIKKDKNNILWAGLDRHASSVNTIDETVLNELNDVLEQNCQGIVFYSCKEKGFIAGADIDVFSQYSESEATNFIQLGQTVFNKLAKLNIPTVALINGFCLGGGCELALACRYRIASDQSDSIMGLPEVLLGIIPAWGGIERSIRLIGAFRALTHLLLAGKNVRMKKALILGLVDAVVPRRQLETAAVYYIQHQPVIPHARFCNGLVSQICQKIIAKGMRLFLKKRVNPAYYPAPYAILDVLEDNTHQENKEIATIKALMAPGGTARELIRVFYLRERLKHLDSLLEKKFSSVIKHVHVVGAGTMGGDIAALCALHGFTVTLSDVNKAAMGRAFVRSKKYFEKHCYEAHTLQATLDRFSLDFEGKGLEKADVVIEAIIENLEVKQAFFIKAEKVAKPTAILATNTSSLPVEAIASVLKEPQRLVGLHFFNPATQMPLVEVIKKEKTSELLTEILAFVIQIGKLPVPVGDSPGFLVNRILTPYLIEGMNLLSEGEDPVCIDEAARAFGMLMGPIELADTVGLDICTAVAKNLSGEQVSTKLQEKVTSGELGKKTGRGFFRYNKRGRRILPWLSRLMWLTYSVSERQKIAAELIQPMIREAEACLNEKVVGDKDLLDAAMIFGAGFAPFRGGPLQYAAQIMFRKE
jgi:3-hydroxyacyl-CoA dehydrogenase/enoyl-CoA hydratase/3-hydroxybutyryl-CoA epimerase